MVYDESKTLDTIVNGDVTVNLVKVNKYLTAVEVISNKSIVRCTEYSNDKRDKALEDFLSFA